MHRTPWTLVAFLFVTIARAEGTPPPRDVHLDATLVDGTRVHGGGAATPLTLFTEYGRLLLPLPRVVGIDLDENGETVTCRMANGDVLHGVIETEGVAVYPPGEEAPPRVVPFRDLRRLRVMPPIRVAGSDEAWWDFDFTHATGWTTSNPGGRLVVTGIEPAVTNTRSGGAWSRVDLGRDVDLPGDFDVSATIAWDAGAAGLRAMQNVFVVLLDADGRTIALGGHNDSWVGDRGGRYSQVAGAERAIAAGTQPLAGRAEVRIGRRGDRVCVLFGGEEMQAGECRAPVRRVVVRFEYYAYSSFGSESVFGTAALERVSVR
jgi:hypothetical protein